MYIKRMRDKKREALKEKALLLVFQNHNNLTSEQKQLAYEYNEFKEMSDKQFSDFIKAKEIQINELVNDYNICVAD